jgi:large subunit ribosomal protein L10
MPTAEKSKSIEQAKEWYSRSVGVVFTDYRGLTVKEMQQLRTNLRSKGGELHVIKNTLFRIAAGVDTEKMPSELHNGTTAIAFVFENEAEVAKSLLDYSKISKKLVVKGGFFGGRAFTDQEVRTLSELPPRDVLISQVIGLVAAPLANLVGTVEALYADPIRVIGAVADKVGEGAGAEGAAEAPAEGSAAAEVSDPENVHGNPSGEEPATPPQQDVEGGTVAAVSEDPSEPGAITADPTATAGPAENAPTTESTEDVGPLPEQGTTETGEGAPGSEEKSE